MEKRATFGSRVGAILAAAGSAVGLGNIWRFPCECGNNGGAAFILVYVACILFVALPILITELSLGRYAKSNVCDAYQKLGGHPAWKWMGFIAVMGGFLVFSYYSVVAGWTLGYVLQSGMGNLIGKASEAYAQDFVQFSSDPLRPIICLIAFIVITCGIVVMGVQKGIERGSKIMMPLLFLLLILLVCCSLTLPDAHKGVEFLFKPDFTKINSGVFLSALGQAFFTLSVGIGTLLTYASYFSDKVNICKDALSVTVIDTLVAILSGLIIFPAAFSVGVNPDAGPSLVFITLPNVFQQAFGSIPALCYTVTLLFYVLLAMAALTSSISMLEITTAFVTEKFHLRRSHAAVAISIFTIFVGAACSMSFGDWSHVTVMGMGIFDLCDFLVAKFAMPIGAICTSVIFGWCLKRDKAYAILSNNGSLNLRIFPLLYAVIRYFIPVAIIVIFVNELL